MSPNEEFLSKNSPFTLAMKLYGEDMQITDSESYAKAVTTFAEGNPSEQMFAAAHLAFLGLASSQVLLMVLKEQLGSLAKAQEEIARLNAKVTALEKVGEDTRATRQLLEDFLARLSGDDEPAEPRPADAPAVADTQPADVGVEPHEATAGEPKPRSRRRKGDGDEAKRPS